ncbi:SMI1/KNR4 family protein [Priestia koreensis]|uniref:SMI1/KNR4 family protein n=1 Tax=Priestia koreensis TaxID=284581 RepID=UPI00203FFC65|nr:SMI1/KNR4 family protein [Priestia koreensis]MCM3005240.1 SMI1/KNR4 family protein [Priestia koreensis]
MSKVQWRSADEPITRDEVRHVEQELGFNFPLDYIECIMDNNGAHVSPEVFEVKGKRKVFGTLLTYDMDDDENIIEVFNDYKDTLPLELIPFAFDPAGNLICFDYKDDRNKPTIVFCEHENAGEKEMLMREEGLTEEQVEELARENVFYIADTFSDFLDKLHD